MTQHDNRVKPTSANEYGPCAICGNAALPKYGVFLCRQHGKLKYAKRVWDEYE